MLIDARQVQPTTGNGVKARVMEFHEPVMVSEVLEALQPKPGAIVVDGTLGSAGHARELARVVGPSGVLIGMDRDPEMLQVGRERLVQEFGEGGPRLIFAARPYEELPEVLREHGLESGVDGVLLDLGINSLQLERAERGFSFSKEGPLDARFNAREGTNTVAELVNKASERELASWLYELADERHARQIARRIVSDRKVQPFTTTTQLAALVTEIYPPKERYGRIHPATRTFQALRIVANDELGAVERGVRACLGSLKPGGVCAVITFHSGEDRIVKQIFRELSSPRPDPENPYSATTTEGIEFVQESGRVTKSSDEEAESNPRARSAKLRVVRRKKEGEL